MVIDSIQNLHRYASLSPYIATVAEFLCQHEVQSLPLGTTVIDGDNAYIKVEQCQPKDRAEAVLESHRLMTDIQLPISGCETHGHRTLKGGEPSTPYNTGSDISFHPDLCPENYVNVAPGQFVIYTPDDAHAPGITAAPLLKAVIKVRASAD